MDFWNLLTCAEQRGGGWYEEQQGQPGEGLTLSWPAGKALCPRAQGTCPLKEAAHSVIHGDKYALEASSIFPISFNLRVTWEHKRTPEIDR